jgi:hypothetical protein
MTFQFTWQNTFVIMAVFFAMVSFQNKHRLYALRQDMTYKEASDGRCYWVNNNKETAQEAANMLASLQKKIKHLLTVLTNSPEIRDTALARGIQRLEDRVSRGSIEFMEHKPEKGESVAINYGKGDAIFVCLFDDRNQAVDMEALFTVVVHELAHITESTTSQMLNGHSVHSDEFKRNEAFLMSKAASLSYVPPGGAVGQSYCNIHLPDPKNAV